MMGDHPQAEAGDPLDAAHEQPRRGSGADVEDPDLKHPA